MCRRRTSRRSRRPHGHRERGDGDQRRLLRDHRTALRRIADSAIWGASVVADSAQFSACVTELADARYIGTALTMQTCIGFLITTASIRLMPGVVDRIGWRYAFSVLAIGPVLGIIAMLRLRQVPEAVKIASGRR